MSYFCLGPSQTSSHAQPQHHARLCSRDPSLTLAVNAELRESERTRIVEEPPMNTGSASSPDVCRVRVVPASIDESSEELWLVAVVLSRVFDWFMLEILLSTSRTHLT